MAQKEAQEQLAASEPKEKGQKGFEKWLRSLPLPVLQAAFDQIQFSNLNKDECVAYVSHVKMIQTVQVLREAWETADLVENEHDERAQGHVQCSRPQRDRQIVSLETPRPPERSGAEGRRREEKKSLRWLLSFCQFDSVVSHSMALPRDSATSLKLRCSPAAWTQQGELFLSHPSFSS
eukprot:2620063-Pyramimonas_sp.AAC.1